MKNINYIQLCVCFFLTTISLLNISCEKQHPPTTVNTPADPLPSGNPGSGVNTLPQAFAGGNVNVEWPHNSVILSGGASHETGTTISGVWEKISGPVNFTFENNQFHKYIKFMRKKLDLFLNTPGKTKLNMPNHL